METVYKWVEGSKMPGDANAAGRVCSELAEQGKLTPEELVNASRDEESPLHGMFEWDDTIAAEKYREVQARKIIRSVEIVMTDSPVPQRAFQTVEHKTYRRIETVMGSEEMRRILLNNAKKELDAFRRKYSRLTELAMVFEAIEKTITQETEE
jgi:polyhydroxyalkanoate synthesis regulator phasin